MTEQNAPLAQLQAALPESGLFAGKTWRFSPQAFPLTDALHAELLSLGERLWAFQRACNDLYALSASGRQPAWVAELLDRGKPPELVEFSRAKAFRNQVPQVLRPDVILTEDGFVLSELDSVPGGIGLTAWLNATYAEAGAEVLGGASGMLEGFAGIAPGGDILISREADTYRPEMEWVASRTGHRVCAAEGYGARTDKRREVYRFFELFDLENIPEVASLQSAALQGELTVTPPFKPYLEEKLWFALFWIRPLRSYWRRALTDRNFLALQKVIPKSWVLDPQPLPPHAELPGLGIHDFSELGDFSQKERELVIKASGFSELAWGARSVVIGSDEPQISWKTSVFQALKAFPKQPHILQRFHKARLFQHTVYDPVSGDVHPFPCRVRLCPYYFSPQNQPKLAGALATLCPPDKKILHGMKDAVLVPASIASTGWTRAGGPLS
ncbi:MAG: hypothetical protein DVB28_000036 [Verrucomicrobia bacterium]|nr:MAG: hypothetical protein DVB28_000036 [Verrucomicrobiota bacterium]